MVLIGHHTLGIWAPCDDELSRPPEQALTSDEGKKGVGAGVGEGRGGVTSGRDVHDINLHVWASNFRSCYAHT